MSQEVNRRFAELDAQIRGLRADLNSSLGPRAIEKRHNAINEMLSDLTATQTSMDNEVAAVRASLDDLAETIPKILMAIKGITERAKGLQEDLKAVRSIPQLIADKDDQERRLADQICELQYKPNDEKFAELLSQLIKLLSDHFSSGTGKNEFEVDGRDVSTSPKQRSAGS